MNVPKIMGRGYRPGPGRDGSGARIRPYDAPVPAAGPSRPSPAPAPGPTGHRRRARVGVVLVLLALVAAACTRAPDAAPDPGTPAGATGTAGPTGTEPGSVPPGTSLIDRLGRGTAPRPPTDDADDGGPSAPIRWTGTGRVQTGTLTVPLDHARPDGPTIDLAVARRPATDPSRRIGSLFFNPGGPGVAGIDYLRLSPLDATLNERFDIVTWDPRGVGASGALGCDRTAAAYHELDWSPDTPAETAALDQAARTIADDCAAAAPDRVGHIDTEATVRDLDQLRRAVGDDQLDYIGFSYGTYIGLRYAERYPDRVRAMVLDGVVDPSDDLERLLTGQTVALETQMDALFASCRAPACTLGDAAAAYDRVAARVEQQPLPAGSSTLGPSALAFAAISSSYDSSRADSFLSALAAADAGDGAPLRAITDLYLASGSFSSYLGVLCTDTPHPIGAADYDAMTARITARSPRFGPAIANEVRPCAFWPAPAVEVPGPVRATGSAPILVVGNTGDVATPFEAARTVADDLDHGVLLTYEGAGHTSFGKSSCVDAAVRAYLTDLTLPDPARACR